MYYPFGSGQPIGNPVTGAFRIVGGEAIIEVLEGIAFFCKTFVSLAAEFLTFLLQPGLYNFHQEEIIKVGWETCRNICNMFFLLILLFIAFCTILQIDKYHAKKTLLTLILMALLINFSRPIATFIFDGAQLLMGWFLKTNGDYATNITKISKIAEVLYKDLLDKNSFRWSIFTWESYPSAIARNLYVIVFTFMYAVALFILGIFLFIRIVAMWVIIILSPFAFLAAAVPDFKSTSSKWWNALFKYSYIGPVIAFFLFLSTKLAETQLYIMADKNRVTERAVAGNSLIPMKDFIPYIVVLVFLYTAIIIAQQFGIQFASAITGAGERAVKGFAGYVTGYRAARWTGRKAVAGAKYGTKAGVDWFGYQVLAPHDLDPRVWWKAWQMRADEVKKDKLSRAQARSQDVFSKAFKAGRKIPEYYVRKAEAERTANFKKEQDSMGTAPEIVLPAMAELYKNRKKMEPEEFRERALAYLQTLTGARDLNEARKMEYLKDLGKDITLPDGSHPDWAQNKPMDASQAPNYVRQIMSAFGITDERDQHYHAKRLGEMALARDDYHLWALEERKPRVRNAMIFGKTGTVKEKQYSGGMHTEALHIKDDKGNVMGIQGGAWPHLRRWNINGYTFLQEMRTQVKSDIMSDGGLKHHKANYDRLLERAESAKRKSEEKGQDPRRRELWKEAAAEYGRQASDEYEMVAVVARETGKLSPSQVQAKKDKVKALTGWDIDAIEKEKTTAQTSNEDTNPAGDDDAITGD